MSSLIREYFPEEHRKVLKEVVAVAFNLEWANFCIWFKHFHTLTTIQYKDQAVENALFNIAQIHNNHSSLLASSDIELKPNNFNKDNPSFENSVYNQYFSELIETQSNQNYSTSNILNPYCNEKFFSIFLKRYIPYVPMWSALLTDGQRFSNAPVERWFGLIKNEVLDEQFNERCSRVIRKISKRDKF